MIDEIEREGGPHPNAGIEKVAPGGGKKTLVWGAIAAAVVVVVAAGGYLLRDTIFPPNEVAVGNTEGVQAAAAAPQAQLTVKSVPPGADVWLNGAFMGKAPVVQQVSAGDVAVMLRQPGYVSMTDTVALVEDEEREVSYSLIELTGRLRIESTPPGAAITVDGAATGKVTPATIENLSVTSPHQIVLQLAGYNTVTFPAVRVEADSTTTLSRAFSRQTSPLTVVSQPAGAEIWIDGSQAGVTPHALERVSYGRHDVTVRLDGYAEWSQAIEIPAPGNRLDVQLVALAPGTIVISVQPWADVYVDGNQIAKQLPYFSHSLPPGLHVIELRNPAYETHSVERRVASGDTLWIRHKFE